MVSLKERKLTGDDQARVKFLVNKLKIHDWIIDRLTNEERKELASIIKQRMEDD